MTPTEIAKQRLSRGQTISKKELSLLYGITPKTLCTWLKRIPGFEVSRNRILKTSELNVIFAFYGRVAQPNEK